MSEFWLVDGYNCLHAIQSLRAGKRKLPQSREMFCSAMAGVAETKKVRLRVVLDGVGPQGELDKYATRLFDAVYSQNVSADHYIERYIYENKSRCSFVVVTNDRTISELARGGGARVLGNADFIEIFIDSTRENEKEILKESIRSHGFNRPFDRQFKSLGF